MADAHARKRRRARPGGGGATDIADDVLRESFARLPGLRDLLRCAATCRRWRRLVTDRAFLQRLGHWPDTARRPSYLVGFFSQNTYPGGSGWRPISKKNPYCYKPPQLLSLQARGCGTRLTFDSFFVFDDDDTLFDLATPLASRCGFLLLQVLLHGDQYRLHLALCCGNSSTHLLPPPPFTDRWSGCAILAGEDCSLDHKQQQQPMPVFKVLLIYTDYTNGGTLCAATYSSHTGCWNAPVDCREPDGFNICGPRAGVVTRGGTVHWLFMDKKNRVYYTLNINVATSHVSWTKIPIKVHAESPIPCTAGEKGRLSFVTIRGHRLIELWTKHEQYEYGDAGENGRECNGVWRCSKLADLGSKGIGLVFFAESRGALLVKQGGAFSAVDLKSKEVVSMHLKKKGMWHVSGTSPVLYEMEWVFSHTLASSQLEDDIRVD
ncbi:unnamed protein product [Alopecurus aequalis]